MNRQKRYKNVLRRASILTGVGAVIFAIFAPLAIAAIPQPTDTPEFVDSFGELGSVNVLPRAIAEHNGSLYVVDQNLGLIKTDLHFEYQELLIPDSPFVTCAFAPSASEFCDVKAMVVGASGAIYVHSNQGNAITKYSAEGEYILTWGVGGSGNGQFSQINAIAVDATENIYVVDSGNSRIQKFDQNGTYITQWGSFGAGNGNFSSPTGIAADTAGNIYVVDAGNKRIQKFEDDGTYLTQWDAAGSWDDANPQHIATDSLDNIFVSDQGYRVKKFNSSGTQLTEWGSSGIGDGEFTQAPRITTEGAGNVFTAESNDDLSYGRMQKFTTNGAHLTSRTGSYENTAAKFAFPLGIGHGAPGVIYVVDTYNSRIQKLSSTGEFISAWGSKGSGNGEFDVPVAVATDSTNMVYVADYENNRIQKFDQNGTYITQWGSSGSGNGQFYGPSGIVVDGADNIYVTDGNDRIQKFDQNGTYITQWGSSGSGNGQFSTPTSIAIDPFGNIFVVDYWNQRIQKFDQNGTYITQWGSEGSGDGQFNTNDPPYPLISLAIDPAGNVYASDAGNQRIQKFDNNGTYLAEWGEAGAGDGQFLLVGGITLDQSGNLYSLDVIGRIQKFAYPQEEVTLTALNPEGDVLNTEILIKTGSFTELTCSEVVTEAAQTTQDEQFVYPLGLVRFCATVAEGSTQQVELYFETQLPADAVVARKYNAQTQQYAMIAGATITAVSLEGKSYLRVSYSVTDGGDLDEDGVVNGEIIDPVGLALLSDSDSGMPPVSTDGGNNALAATGQSSTVVVFVALSLLIGAGSIARVSYRPTRR